jgi:hypothetical protein
VSEYSIGTTRSYSPNLQSACRATAAALQQHLKGAQMRSCSSAVLMEQTAEQVASMKAALAILADKVQSDGWGRRLKLERPVCTMGVVIRQVGSARL